MIAFDKGPAPAVLVREGPSAAGEHCRAYDEDPGAYVGGTKRFEFKGSVYRHRTVVAALEAVQKGKCAYCEVVVPRPYADVHIDHWRPKGAVSQSRDSTASRPGYYWLAYEWDNLFIACAFCNRDNKKALFPLVDPAERVVDHHGDLDGERPLLLKPDDGTDPARHIEFVEELPRGLTPRGEKTIDVIGLDRLEHKARDDLITLLRDHHEKAWEYASDPHPAAVALVAQAKAFYVEAQRPSAPFTAMVRAFALANPLPV